MRLVHFAIEIENAMLAVFGGINISHLQNRFYQVSIEIEGGFGFLVGTVSLPKQIFHA